MIASVKDEHGNLINNYDSGNRGGEGGLRNKRKRAHRVPMTTGESEIFRRCEKEVF